jgi:alpha-ribazole phosphatase
MSRLLLVRHGETALNSSLRFWGKTDVELGNAGIQQAQCLRDRLASEKIKYAYASQLKRSFVTAETVMATHHLNVIKSSFLNEIDFGELEGLDFQEVKARYPEVTRRWIQHDLELQYPGGESLGQMQARVKEFVNLLNAHSENETILIVAHSGILRTLICQLLGLGMDHFWNLRVDLASISIVETYPEIPILSLLNDVSHLVKGKNK